MLVAACLAFAVAAVAGLALAALSSWWLVAVGAVCIVAAWTYTGGPIPYGYRALGEVFVFVFFGLVAVVGTTFVQTGTRRGAGRSPSSVPIGLLIVAILVVNNLRDIDGDAAVGKRTLAVLLGDRGHAAGRSPGCSSSPFAVVAGRRHRPAVGAARAARRAARRAAGADGARRRPRAGAHRARWRAPGLLTLATGVLLGAGLALSG